MLYLVNLTAYEFALLSAHTSLVLCEILLMNGFSKILVSGGWFSRQRSNRVYPGSFCWVSTADTVTVMAEIHSDI